MLSYAHRIRKNSDFSKNNRGASAAAWLLALALACGLNQAYAQDQASAQGGAQTVAAQQKPLTKQETDLFIYVTRDNAGAVRRLLEQGTNPNVFDSNGQTPMTWALQSGSLKAFDSLMAFEATNVEFRNASDESPLMMAALKGNLDAVTRLLRLGAHVNKTLWSPLHYAASGTGDNQEAIIRLLLAHNAYIDPRSPNDTTPLMMAAQYGSGGVVTLLLAEGADPTMQNQLGLTATDFASRSGREGLTRQIAEAAEKLSKERAQIRKPSTAQRSN